MGGMPVACIDARDAAAVYICVHPLCMCTVLNDVFLISTSAGSSGGVGSRSSSGAGATHCSCLGEG